MPGSRPPSRRRPVISMRPSATSLEQLRALVWDDVRLRERLYQPDDIRSFIALAVASGRDHGLELGVEDIEAAMRANRQAQRRSEEHTSELQSRLHLVCRL